MSKKLKEKQHTVPSSYLQGFWNIPNWRKTELFMLNVQNQKLNKTLSWTVTMEKDFYTIFWKNWERDLTIEDFFSNTIEKEIPLIVKKIKRKDSLNKKDKVNLANFIAFQELRSITRREIDTQQNWDFLKMAIRSIIQNLENHHDRKESLQRFIKKHFNYDLQNIEADNYIQSTIKWENIQFEPRLNNMVNMLELAPKIWEIIYSRQWFFIHTPKDRPIIVSDYPIYLHPLWNSKWIFNSPGFLTTDFIGFPISKNCYMICWEILRKQQIPIHTNISDIKMIRLFNYQTAYYTNKNILWCNDKLLNRINKDIIKMDLKLKKENS